MMAKKDPALPRIPRVVRKEISEAYAPFNHLEPEEIERRLQDHRDKKIAAIRTGIVPALTSAREPREPGFVDLERLERARRALRSASTPEGASDYVSEAAFGRAMSSIRKKPARTRGTAYDVESIRAEATLLGYWSDRGKDGPTLKDLRDEIIRRLRLRQQNKATSPDSMHRALERILKLPKDLPDI